MTSSMIFHCPFPVVEAGKSGSQVRPYQMLKAFTQIGYEVVAVTGYERERALTIEQIKREVQQGRRFDFVYSESATVPTLLTERLRHHKHPSLDFSFWHWLRGQGVPVGLFYRDIFWRTDYRKIGQTWRDRLIKTPLYWYDWFCYRWLVDTLFLPSLEMAAALPTRWPAEKMQALPPGCEIVDLAQPPATADSRRERLHLFYVGSVELPFYDLKPVMEMICDLPHISLTLCCRLQEWERWQTHYLPLPCDRIRVVHAAGEQLRPYYAAADAFLLVWQPNPYLDFAMPVKVFEALGYGVPMIINEGLRASRFVAEANTGWVASSQAELRTLILHLASNAQEIQRKREHLHLVREHHTWAKRAETVATVLNNLKRGR